MTAYSFFQAVLRQRGWIFLAIVTLLAPLAFFAAQVQTDNSLDRLVSPSGEERAAFQRFGQTFGSDEFILIGLQARNLTSEAYLSKMDELELALQKVPFLVRTRSLISTYRSVHPLFNPSSAKDRQDFERFVSSSSFWAKQGLIAPGRMLSLVMQLNVHTPDERRTVVSATERILKPFQELSPSPFERIRKVGQPYLNFELDTSTSEIGQLFLPIYLFFSVGFTFLLYRSFKGSLAVLLCVLVSLAMTVGLVALSGSVLTMLSSIMPIMVMILSTETCIYIYATWVGLRDEIADPRERLLKALALKWKPCWYAILTTLIGFAAFLPSNMRTVRDLGTFVAIGVLIAYAISMTLFPILFDWLKPPLPKSKAPGAFAKGVSALLSRLPELTRRARFVIVPLSLVLGVLAYLAYAAMDMETDTLSYLSPKSQVFQDTTYVQEHLMGLMSLELMLEGEKGQFAEPEALKALQGFEADLRRAPMVQSTLSPTTLLTSTHFISTGQDGYPQNNFTLTKYITLLSQQDVWNSYISHDFDRLRISTVTKGEDRAAFASIRSHAERAWADFRQEHPEFKDVKLVFTGMSPLIANISKYLYDTLDFSFMISIVAVFCVYLLQLRHLKFSFAALLPSVLSIFLMYWVMELTGTRLDVGTVVIASIVMGVADNASIHLLQHYTERRQTGAAMLDALRYSFAVSGRGVFIAATVIIVGFVTFGLSDFPPIRHFGLYTGVAIAFALAGTLLFMPAFLWIVTPKKEQGGKP